MDKETVGMRITDIPMDFYNDATRQIINFGIGIVKVAESDRGEDAILIGSGTLVNFNEGHFILTAQHVIDALPTIGNIGFVISHQSSVHTLRHPGR